MTQAEFLDGEYFCQFNVSFREEGNAVLMCILRKGNAGKVIITLDITRNLNITMKTPDEEIREILKSYRPKARDMVAKYLKITDYNPDGIDLKRLFLDF